MHGSLPSDASNIILAAANPIAAGSPIRSRRHGRELSDLDFRAIPSGALI
jgi:hypothetical protein